MANIKGIELASEINDLEDTSARNTATAASQTATQAGQTATQAGQTATQASQTATQASQKVDEISKIIPSSASDSNKLVTESELQAVTELIPSNASVSNKLATVADIETSLSWVYLGQGKSADTETVVLTVNLSGKKDVMFVFRTTSDSTENLGTCIVPASELAETTMFRQGYISYVPNSSYCRYTVVSRSDDTVNLALTSNMENAEIAVYAR